MPKRMKDWVKNFETGTLTLGFVNSDKSIVFELSEIYKDFAKLPIGIRFSAVHGACQKMTDDSNKLHDIGLIEKCVKLVWESIKSGEASKRSTVVRVSEDEIKLIEKQEQYDKFSSLKLKDEVFKTVLSNLKKDIDNLKAKIAKKAEERAAKKTDKN